MGRNKATLVGKGSQSNLADGTQNEKEKEIIEKARD